MNQEGKAPYKREDGRSKKADYKVQKRNGRGRKMAFLDGVKGKISKAGYSTMQKAKDLSEITKLNMAVSESETKINEIYSEIGYKVYCAYRENPLEEVKEEIG